MADDKTDAFLQRQPLHHTNHSSTNHKLLAFGDLVEGHTNDLGVKNISDDFENDILDAFNSQPWRDGPSEICRVSQSASSSSSEYTDSPLGDSSGAITEQQMMDKTGSVKPNERLKIHDDDQNEPILRQIKTLHLPPCLVCGGKASGDHYGINSCEACKGFFRRYLLRKKGAYECRFRGQCEITHTKKGMCAGCRLKKCLKLGMSKDKCKLGRYTSEKRTKKIQTMRAMKDNITFNEADLSTANYESPGNDVDIDIFTKTLAKLKINDDTEESFTEDLIPVLIQAKRQMHPFGKDINADNIDEIKQYMRRYYEEFHLKVELYGERKTVSKEDFEQLYKSFGIDVDDRLSDFRDGMGEVHSEVYEMCNFAKHIPYFSKLSLRDQSTLLKVNSVDSSIFLCYHGYDPDLQIVCDRRRCYHVSEMDKIFSQELMSEWLKCCITCQKLNLSEREQVLVMAFSLFFTDRCSLENPRLVEKIHLSLTKLLKDEIGKTSKGSSCSRFAKIVELLTDMRKPAEMMNNELEIISKDEIYGKEFPILTDFIVKDVPSSVGTTS